MREEKVYEKGNIIRLVDTIQESTLIMYCLSLILGSERQAQLFEHHYQYFKIAGVKS